MAELAVNPTKDVYLSSKYPDTNKDSGLTFLFCSTLVLSEIGHAVLHFDISALPAGTTVSSAILDLKVYSFTQQAKGETLEICKLSRTDWVETEATWNSYKSGTPWTTAGGDFVRTNPTRATKVLVWPGDGSTNIDITAIVQDAIDNTIDVHILVRFVDGTPNVCSWNFKSMHDPDTIDKPKLTITYSVAPTVTTQAVTAITAHTATGNGNKTGLGTPVATQYGVCWNTTGSPTTADSKTEEGPPAVTGAFTSSIIGLIKGTTYYVRAYMTNSEGTVYGGEVNFVATAEKPEGTIWGEGTKFHQIDEDGYERSHEGSLV